MICLDLYSCLSKSPGSSFFRVYMYISHFLFLEGGHDGQGRRCVGSPRVWGRSNDPRCHEHKTNTEANLHDTWLYLALSPTLCMACSFALWNLRIFKHFRTLESRVIAPRKARHHASSSTTRPFVNFVRRTVTRRCTWRSTAATATWPTSSTRLASPGRSSKAGRGHHPTAVGTSHTPIQRGVIQMDHKRNGKMLEGSLYNS